MTPPSRNLELSIVVMAYGMARELPRTVRSLCRPYQQGIDDLRYEILVVDNGSPIPVDAPGLEAIAPEVRVVRFEAEGPSPAKALNRAVKMTAGENLALIVDGARMVTPGVLALARRALGLHEQPFISLLAWHLGPAVQWMTMRQGYGPEVEDQLLARIGWPADGYQLFHISALAGANEQGWFGPLNEATFAVLRRSLFCQLGGYDERFSTPGGGFMTLEFFARAVAAAKLVVLLGEGTFHQIHGGVAANATDPQAMVGTFAAEYAQIMGRPYQPPALNPEYVGHLPAPTRRFIQP